MSAKRERLLPARRIAPNLENPHCFFGYYDIPAFSGDGSMHLFNSVPQWDHLPQPGERNQMGYVELESGKIHYIAQTDAWNFQQGSMLQWYPKGSNTQVLYNVFEQGKYGCVIRDISTGEIIKKLPLPVANVSGDGKYGLSINFNRLYDFRPGYGYGNVPDPYKDVLVPEEDGIFLMDMGTGAHRLLISFPHLAQLFHLPANAEGSKLVINHINFNPSSQRFIFLVRYYHPDTGQWKTGIGSSDLQGNVYVWRQYTYASHYFWKDSDTLLIHADAGEGPALYELEDLSQRYRIIAQDFVAQDIHCSYDPALNYVIGDGYPDQNGMRSIFLYDLKKEEGMVIGKFYSPNPPIVDIRCDLHIRWHPAGRMISFDSVHEGDRGVYTMDLADVLP